MSVTTEDGPRLLYRDMRSRLEEIVDEQIKEQVLAGIEELNDKYGPNWVDLIDPRTLYLESGSACVLGKVYSDYDAGVKALRGGSYFDEEDANDEWAEARGFYRDDGEYEALTMAWRVVLADA